MDKGQAVSLTLMLCLADSFRLMTRMTGQKIYRGGVANHRITIYRALCGIFSSFLIEYASENNLGTNEYNTYVRRECWKLFIQISQIKIFINISNSVHQDCV